MTDEFIGELVTSVASHAADVIAGSHIPEPIKRNFFKAVGQLCTAAVEIPVAYMEGVASEKRAETAGRVKLIEKSANEIAAQMNFDPEYAKAAVRKFGQRVVREQINLDRITEKAAESLSETPTDRASIDNAGTTDSDPLSDDWLNVFEREAANKSSEEMQTMFAQILAGEIRKPNTFSIRSVRILGTLDQKTALIFKRLCSKCIVLSTPHGEISFDARVPSLGANASANGLEKYGLSFDTLNVLQEHGLIIPDYNSWMDYTHSVGSSVEPISLAFKFDNREWGLAKMEGYRAGQLRIHGVGLTRSGQELMSVVAADADAQFGIDLSAWFKTQKLEMVQAVRGQPRP